MALLFRTSLYRIFGSPAYDRLANDIALTWMEFDIELHRSGHGAVTEPWARTAYKLLLSAETSLANWQIDMGWTVLLAAQRAILSNPHNPDKLKRTAITLWREKAKIGGWRTRSVFERYAIVSQADIVEALGRLELRDGHSLGHSEPGEANPDEPATA